MVKEGGFSAGLSTHVGSRLKKLTEGKPDFAPEEANRTAWQVCLNENEDGTQRPKEVCFPCFFFFLFSKFWCFCCLIQIKYLCGLTREYLCTFPRLLKSKP